MTQKFWLVKQEPAAYAWSDLLREGHTDWTGVRNYQARNNLQAMQPEDSVLFYHSQTERAVVGLAAVELPAFPDPTATAGNWVAVQIRAVRPFVQPVTLAQIKAHPQLQNVGLIKQSQLSVMPLSPNEFALICNLGGLIFGD